MSVVLRAARVLDAGAVGGLLSGFVSDTEWMPDLHSAAETIAFAEMMISKGWVTVAEKDEEVVGFMARDGAFVHSLYLRADAQGEGIGTQLLNAAKEASQRLELYTFQANTGAQRFYERHGFTEVERTDGAGNDEKLPDIKYVWRKEVDAA